MKHLFLAVVTFAAITGGNAQTPTTGNVPFQSVSSVPLSITAGDIVGRKDKPFDGNTQAAAWQTVFRTEARYLFHFSQNSPAATVIEYDAPSNSLSLVRSAATFAGDGSITAKVGVMRSNDMGQSWTFDVVKDLVGFFGMPNMAQIRTGSNPLAWPVFLYGVGYGQTGTPLGYYTAYYRVDGQVSELAFSAPPSGQPNYKWNAADLAVDKENMSIMGISQLDYVRSIGVQYGEYGFFNFSLGAEDFVTEGTVDNFGTSVFAQPNPPNTDGSLGTPPLLDIDADNRIYAAFNNILPGGEARTVVVATSEDQGVTWSALNAMPTSLISQLKTTIGADVIIQLGLTAYQGSAFIVTAPNEFSYFYRVAAGPFAAGDTTQFNIRNHYVLEARYKAGVWTLAPAAELFLGLGIEGVRLEYPEYSIDTSTYASDNVPRVSVEASGRSIEIEVAKTGDGNLLIKYLDQVPDKVIEINPPVALRVRDAQRNLVDASDLLDSLAWTDIFIASRPLTGNAWSTPVNVSNDMAFNKGTYMPREVPSLSKIPLVQIRSLVGTGPITSRLPAVLVESLADQPGDVQFATVDNVTDVREERTYAFRINNVVPNPALNLADVTFSLDNGAPVTAELFDVLGNKVRTIIAPTFLGAGLHGVSLDVNTLAAGQYYVAVTVGGKRLTRSLVVVK